jgi:hypothetical protein
MLLNAMNSYGTVTRSASQPEVTGMRPMGCMQYRLRFDGSEQHFNKRKRSGDYGSEHQQ